MKALVVYDSAYGNTEKIAKALAMSITPAEIAEVVQASEEPTSELESVDLLIVGSPTQGGRPTKPIQQYIKTLPSHALNGKHVAAFDTRFAMSSQGLGLRLVMKTIGFAAARIASGLQAKGGILVSRPEGFIVTDKEGPLKQGELERAAKWIQTLMTTNKDTASHV
jgi:flavodoxin